MTAEAKEALAFVNELNNKISDKNPSYPHAFLFETTGWEWLVKFGEDIVLYDSEEPLYEYTDDELGVHSNRVPVKKAIVQALQEYRDDVNLALRTARKL